MHDTKRIVGELVEACQAALDTFAMLAETDIAHVDNVPHMLKDAIHQARGIYVPGEKYQSGEGTSEALSEG